jgi:heterodisulfide reductase subunit A-like polyferredoxin
MCRAWLEVVLGPGPGPGPEPWAPVKIDNNDSWVVICAGHSGLDIAARSKYIGVPTLIVDKKPRVGDNVRPCVNLNLSHEHF